MHTRARVGEASLRVLSHSFSSLEGKKKKKSVALFKQTYSPDDERGFLKINRCGWRETTEEAMLLGPSWKNVTVIETIDVIITLMCV